MILNFVILLCIRISYDKSLFSMAFTGTIFVYTGTIHISQYVMLVPVAFCERNTVLCLHPGFALIFCIILYKPFNAVGDFFELLYVQYFQLNNLVNNIIIYSGITIGSGS